MLKHDGLGSNAKKYKSSKLEKDKIKKLESIGVSWAPDDDFWDAMYLRISAIKPVNGKCHIPYDHPDNRLFNWATNQRALKRKGLLAADREKKLDAIVFDWNPVDDSGFEEKFAKLVEFKARKGHCNVPQRHVEGTIPLGKWLNQQRTQKDSMPAERRQRLDALGVVWNLRATTGLRKASLSR